MKDKHMLDFEVFKSKLPAKAQDMNNEQVYALMQNMEQAANLLFDKWKSSLPHKTQKEV